MDVRKRLLSVVLASSLALTGAVGIVADAGPAGAAVPKCKFGNSALPIVMGVRHGQTIRISCTGLTPLNPYLVLQASLLIGIDPEAKALLSGNTQLSPALLTAALAALPKVNPDSISTQISDASGNLTFDYTVPTSQAPDPNAACPPPKIQFNSGLIGCALAMVDLVTQKPVGAGSAVLQWAGMPFLPPSPTLALEAKHVTRGQYVKVGEQLGRTGYWWISTLAALNNLLTGGKTLPKAVVRLGPRNPKKATVAWSDVHALPAQYNDPVFTPPRLVGRFRVPFNLSKGKRVTVNVSQNMLGITLSNESYGRVKIR
jgi:hypothetical protein